MKNPKTPIKFPLAKHLAVSLGLAVASLLPLGSASVRAATQTWTGLTSGTWETTTNWSTTTPSANDIALWDTPSTANLNITLGSSESVLGLKVISPSGAANLSG